MPSAEEQKEAMVHLENTCPMKEGETWCLVYYRWMEAFKSYTGVISFLFGFHHKVDLYFSLFQYLPAADRFYYMNTYRRYDPPGSIDNSFLLSDGLLRR